MGLQKSAATAAPSFRSHRPGAPWFWLLIGFLAPPKAVSPILLVGTLAVLAHHSGVATAVMVWEPPALYRAQSWACQLPGEQFAVVNFEQSRKFLEPGPVCGGDVFTRVRLERVDLWNVRGNSR